jgi:hypothetical protein
MIGCFVPGETFQLGLNISVWPANLGSFASDIKGST